MCVFSLCLSGIFLILRRTERDMVKKFYLSSCKLLVFLSDFNETECYRQIFEKYSNITFHETPSIGSRVVPRGRTEARTDGEAHRHDASNSRFLQFCEDA